MCGVVSLFRPRGGIDQTRLKKAADALLHRGPDGEGFYLSIDHTCGLGHRRLSIIDLQTGSQPLSNEDGTIHAVVNGEFYGYQAIRDALTAQGHKFKTASDSEILIHLYESYGIDCLSQLRGEFAFILYDEKNKRIFAGRDRFGIKPLCYAAADDGTLYLASEAKAIFAAGFKAAWDDYSFFHAASLQYVPTDRTLFQGVNQLQPGHFLTCDANGLKIQKYWDLDYATVEEEKTDDEWLDIFTTEFTNAVRLRLQADVPICAHLSGGLDSSTIAATASQLSGKPIDCFTVSFDEDGYDELPVAKEMADKIGSPLHVVKVSPDDMIHAIPDAVWYSEGLSINGHLAGKYFLNREIRKAGFKVALSGEGSDELLAGYPHLREDMILQDTDGSAKRDTLYESNDKLAGVFLQHGDALSTTAVDKALGYTPSFMKAKASFGLRMHGLLNKETLDKMNDRDIYDDVIQSMPVAEQLTERHIVNQSSFLWTKLTLANYILRTLGDGCEMAHSIEGRVPFLDHILFEKLRPLPMHLKIRDLKEKFILREMAKPLVTKDIYERQKHPFIAPPVSRFSNPALDIFIRDTLSSQKFAEMPFFDTKKIKNWLDNLPNLSPKDQVAAEPVLMTILTSFLVHERFAL